MNESETCLPYLCPSPAPMRTTGLSHQALYSPAITFFPPSFSLCLHNHILLCWLHTAQLCSYTVALFFCVHNHPPNYLPSKYSERLRIPWKVHAFLHVEDCSRFTRRIKVGLFSWPFNKYLLSARQVYSLLNFIPWGPRTGENTQRALNKCLLSGWMNNVNTC